MAIIRIDVLMLILLIHWIADFVLQTDKQAKNKSKSNIYLLSHTSIYSIIWFIPMLYYMYYIHVIYFIIITFVTHTIIDYISSRINSKLWASNKVHYFFVNIGFDQLLHYIQLIITFNILINKI